MLRSRAGRFVQGNRFAALALLLSSASIADARLRGLRLSLRSTSSRPNGLELPLRGALFAPRSRKSGFERRPWQFIHCTDGAALIEAALILPLLLLLVFALADLSLYFWQRSLAGKAVQLGARTAIVSDSVAVGPGLTPEESETYWYGLPPGSRCGPEGGVCPAFRVVCSARDGCTCAGGRCRFSVSLAKLAPILAAMRVALPQLAPENVEIAYATNGLGTVGVPPPVPVDVTVRIVELSFTPIFSGVFGTSFPLTASSTLPSEDLVTQR